MMAAGCLTSKCRSCYRKPVEYFLRVLDELTLEDLVTLAQKIMSSPLTMASCGDGSFLIYQLNRLKHYEK